MTTDQYIAVGGFLLAMLNTLLIPILTAAWRKVTALETALADFKLDTATKYHTKDELEAKLEKIDNKLEKIFDALHGDTSTLRNRRSTDRD